MDPVLERRLLAQHDDGVDVVVVPDFEGPAAAQFEVCSLLFLAAWMEHQGASRSWPLHLACIGAPPRLVRAMAEEAGASVTVHGPLVANVPSSNKIRGFEVAPRGRRILLVDADILVLKDLGPLAALIGSGIGVAVNAVNNFPEDTWKRMYETVGVPYPGPTGTCLCADDHLADARGLPDEWRAICHTMPPYFNSGVVMAPWSLDLGVMWEHYLRRISPLLVGPARLSWWGTGAGGDEYALAIAVEACRLRGTDVVLIPRAYHGRSLLVRTAVQPWSEVAVFHHHRALRRFARRIDDLRHLPDLVPTETWSVLGPFYEHVGRLYYRYIRPVQDRVGSR